MALLKKKPFFLLLLVVFFCLHGSVENYGYINLSEVLKVGGIITGCIAILYAFSLLFTKDPVFASLVIFFVCLWYLFFGAIHDFIKAKSYLQFLQSFTILIPVLIGVNILVIWLLKRSKQVHQKLLLYLNVLFLLFCITDGVLLVNRYFNFKESAVTIPVNFDQAKVTVKPNVYFLLFDEYAGYKSLQDSFGFKNDSLYAYLYQQQFKELPTISNYDFTPFSMSSILNMQYVPENYHKFLLTQPDIQHRFGEIRNALVFEIFKNMNYNIENNSIFDIKDNSALYRYNGLFPLHAALLTNKIFHNRLIKGIGWWFVSGRFGIPYLRKHYLYLADDYNLQVEQKVLKTTAVKSGQPRFCYAHYFLPHGRFYRDSSGALNIPEKILDIKHLTNKSLYLSYLKYTNNVIKKLVNNISTNDPGALVIIMSDHGYYDYDNPGDYNPYNYNNICFVKFPGNIERNIRLPKSNVNIFRYIFNTAYGQNLPYLQDSTVLIIEDPAVLR